MPGFLPAFLRRQTGHQVLVGRTLGLRPAGRRHHGPLLVSDEQVQHGRELLSGQTAERLKVWIDLETERPGRDRQREHLVGRVHGHHHGMDRSAFHLHCQRETKPVRRPDLREPNPQSDHTAGHPVAGGHGLGDAQAGGPRTLHPLREEPSEVLPCSLCKHTLQIPPRCGGTSVVGHQLADTGPKRLVPDLAPQHVEDHRCFLVADGVVLLVGFPPEPSDRVVRVRTHVDRIPQQHHPALLARLFGCSGQLVIVIVGQVGGQPLHPVARPRVVEHPVPEPRMHDLVAEGEGLDVMPLHDPAPQQSERRHPQPAGEEILHHGELREGIGAQQLRVGLQVLDRRL